MNQQQSLHSTPRRMHSGFGIDFQNGEHDTSINVEIAYSCLTQSLIVIILFNVFIILLISSFTYALSFRIPILFLSIIHLLYIIKMSIIHHKFQKRDYDCCFQFVWGLSVITYYSCLIYYIEYVKFKIQYSILQLFGLTLVWTIYSFCIMKKERNVRRLKQLMEIIIKFCFVTQLLLINLKLIDWITIKWMYTFSILWLLLFVSIFLQTLCVFNLTIKIINYLQTSNISQKKQLMSKIIGMAWMNILVLSFSGVPTFTLINVCLLLEGDKQPTFILAIIVSLFYTLAYLAYTVFHKDILILFIINLNNLKLKYFAIDTTPPTQILSFPSARNQNKRTFAFKDNNHLLSEFPSQLIKISSTYYLPEELEQRRNKTELNSAVSSKQQTNTEIACEAPLKQCFNCCQQESCAVYMPCGHGGICEKCATDWFRDRKECLICRCNIHAILKIAHIDDQRVKIVDIIVMN